MKGVKRMKRMVAALLAAVTLLSLSGCAGGGTSAGKTDWVTYQEVFDRVKNEENKDILVYSYQQPVLSEGFGGANIINTKLGNSTTAFLYGSGGVEEMSALAKMDWKESWFTCYSLTREVSVARVDETVASFRYSDYAFTGGVHGYTAEYGVSYDMVSGEQLSLGSLTHDEWALREACRQYIIELLGDEENPVQGLFPDYQEYLDVVLKNWVLTDKGLQFIAQPYVLAAYASGTLRFTVPYESIAHVLDEKWMPADRGHGGGTIQVKAVQDGTPVDNSFVIDDEGMSMVVRVNGTVYDFSVEEVSSYPAGGTMVYYMRQQHLFSPKVSSDSFGLQVSVPDTYAETMLRWKDGDGKEYQYYLTYDGKNGGVLLQEANPQLTRE